jgi:two-component system, LytTR family, sensor kinase
MTPFFFGKRYKTILFFFVLASINALLNTLIVVNNELMYGGSPNFLMHFFYEATGSYSFFILMPLMLLLIYKLPFKKGKILIRIPIYSAAIFGFGLVHTLIMYITREMIFKMAGWGVYDYGSIPYRIAMETLKLFVGFTIVYFSFNFIITYREKQKQALQTAKLEEQLTRVRLEFLRNQIHPHFLFNTLNMISSLMYENVNEADRMIANLSDLLRTALKTSGTGFHTLKKEVEILKFYLEIMQARFKDKLDVTFNIDEKYFDLAVPVFMLQPLVENSIKYGMENLSFVKIILNAEDLNDKLVITIEDNGPGIHIDPEKVFKRGVGLSNTQERLEKLFGNNFEFFWENLDPKGLRLSIIIPIVNES